MLKGSFFFSCLKFLSNEGVNFLDDYNFNFNYYEVIFNCYLYLFLIQKKKYLEKYFFFVQNNIRFFLYFSIGFFVENFGEFVVVMVDYLLDIFIKGEYFKVKQQLGEVRINMLVFLLYLLNYVFYSGDLNS